MQYAYDDMKIFDARMVVESKKMNDLVIAFKKLYE